MHITTVTLKDGRTLRGYLWKWRPVEGYLTLMGSDEQLRFVDITRATTEGSRTIAINAYDRREIVEDEIQRAQVFLQDARKYAWYSPDQLKPQAWE